MLAPAAPRSQRIDLQYLWLPRRQLLLTLLHSPEQARSDCESPMKMTRKRGPALAAEWISRLLLPLGRWTGCSSPSGVLLVGLRRAWASRLRRPRRRNLSPRDVLTINVFYLFFCFGESWFPFLRIDLVLALSYLCQIPPRTTFLGHILSVVFGYSSNVSLAYMSFYSTVPLR